MFISEDDMSEAADYLGGGFHLTGPGFEWPESSAMEGLTVQELCAMWRAEGEA